MQAKNLFCIQSTEPLYTKEVSVGVHISIQKSPPHLIPEDTLKIFICAVVQKQGHLSRRDNDQQTSSLKSHVQTKLPETTRLPVEKSD